MSGNERQNIHHPSINRKPGFVLKEILITIRAPTISPLRKQNAENKNSP